MYAETGMFYPYLQNYSLENQQLEEYCKSHKSDASTGSMIQSSTVSEYDLTGDCDLFKAPELPTEEPISDVDPMTAAISMISCGDEIINSQGLKVSDIDLIQSDQLLSDVFYECSKDLMEQEAIETPLSEVLDIKIPISSLSENQIQENKLLPDFPFQKSISASCLTSMEWGHNVKPSFLVLPGVDFEEGYAMRRAFSEGDMKTLSNGNNANANVSLNQPPFEHPVIIGNCTAEDRREKLSRYRNKKSKRNFDRKIKYACRKALADSQPRIRGRFARTEDSDISKKD